MSHGAITFLFHRFLFFFLLSAQFSEGDAPSRATWAICHNVPSTWLKIWQNLLYKCARDHAGEQIWFEGIFLHVHSFFPLWHIQFLHGWRWWFTAMVQYISWRTPYYSDFSSGTVIYSQREVITHIPPSYKSKVWNSDWWTYFFGQPSHCLLVS